MIINASQILERIAPEMPPIAVRDAAGELLFSADYDRVIELCIAGQVCGRCKGRSTLRYLELIVPLVEVCKPFEPDRSRGGVVAQDSRTINREGSLISHDFPVCATFGGPLRHIARRSSYALMRTPSHVIRQAYAECSAP